MTRLEIYYIFPIPNHNVKYQFFYLYTAIQNRQSSKFLPRNLQKTFNKSSLSEVLNIIIVSAPSSSSVRLKAVIHTSVAQMDVSMLLVGSHRKQQRNYQCRCILLILCNCLRPIVQFKPELSQSDFLSN